MASEVRTSAEDAWAAYRQIETLVNRKYKLLTPSSAFAHAKVYLALGILGKAVLLRYRLDKDLIANRWAYTLDNHAINNLPLSTIDEMMNAKIPIWEDAEEPIPDMLVAHDSWVGGTEGKAAGFRPGPSLKETLGHTFSELETIVNTPPETARSIFDRIQKVVQRELDRLNPTLKKSAEIQEALNRLNLALRYKYEKMILRECEDMPEISPHHVASIDLYTIDTMLDAKFKKEKEGRYERQMSLREALNLPRLGGLFGLKSPLWGKADALINVEAALYRA